MTDSGRENAAMDSKFPVAEHQCSEVTDPPRRPSPTTVPLRIRSVIIGWVVAVEIIGTDIAILAPS